MRHLLLIALAFASLPAQDTPAVKCGFAEQATLINKTSSPQSRDLDFLEESVISPSGIFRVHFTRTGYHAVLGAEVSGTPDFVNEAALAADSAYTLQIDKLGFLTPVSDGGVDGIELDIYIKNWGGSYYGMTYFESYAPSPTYLVVDNDFSETNYATSGLAALRVTIAHEFSHMVQLRYDHPSYLGGSNVFWYEISSVWFEEYCYPEVNDYQTYVGDNFQAAQFPALNSYNYMYGHGLFGQILDFEYGIRNGNHIMVAVWENLNGTEALENLDQTLRNAPWNSTFEKAFEQYAIYNAFTGSRAVEGHYYPDAAELPEIHTKENILFTDEPNVMTVEIEPYMLYYSSYSPYERFGTFVSKTESLPGADLGHFQLYFPNAENYDIHRLATQVWTDEVFLKEGVDLIHISVNASASMTGSCQITTLAQTDFLVLSPNPIELSQNQLKLNFIKTLEGVTNLTIYNILGQPVHEETQFLPVGLIETEMHIHNSLASGIYFVRAVSASTVATQKFTVLK
ncbi:T9SS type A sorting domain-containing protein [bacterium]|nr:T9SS type A sorting domain-containing protein [bacterium]